MKPDQDARCKQIQEALDELLIRINSDGKDKEPARKRAVSKIVQMVELCE